MSLVSFSDMFGQTSYIKIIDYSGSILYNANKTQNTALILKSDWNQFPSSFSLQPFLLLSFLDEHAPIFAQKFRFKNDHAEGGDGTRIVCDDAGSSVHLRGLFE
mgnify:CR=1 FL=1